MCRRKYKTAKKLWSKLQTQERNIILITRRTMRGRGLFVRDVFEIGRGKDTIVGTADTHVNTFFGGDTICNILLSKLLETALKVFLGFEGG